MTWLRDRLRAQRHARRAYRWFKSRQSQPDWSALGPPPTPRTLADGRRQRILMATSVGGMAGLTTFDSLLAMALRLRSADTEALLCDAALPACQFCSRSAENPKYDFVNSKPEMCGTCHGPAERTFASLNMPVHRYSTYLHPEDLEEIAGLVQTTPVADIPLFVRHGVPIGEHAMAGCLRYYGRGDLDGQPMADELLLRYFESALRADAAVRRLLNTHAFDRVVIQHGIYVPQGVIRDVCRVLGVPVVAWDRAYRDHTFILSHDDTHHRALGAEPRSVWHRPLTVGARARLHQYLKARRTGADDWVGFQRSPEFDLSKSPALRRLDARPRVALLTSVVWDARIHYPANAFPSMLAWVLATIQHFRHRPDLQLVIRIHPAEVLGSRVSLQRISDELARLVPDLPENVLVVPPDDPVSTYAIADTCVAALIFNTKTGMELAPTGLPVVVAGEAWTRGKGFTTDVSSPEEYETVLGSLPFEGRLSPEQIARAEAFAYHIFFRRMLPLMLLKSPGLNRVYQHTVKSWTQLEPGADPALDIMCRGILDGTPFEAETADGLPLGGHVKPRPAVPSTRQDGSGSLHVLFCGYSPAHFPYWSTTIATLLARGHHVHYLCDWSSSGHAAAVASAPEVATMSGLTHGPIRRRPRPSRYLIRWCRELASVASYLARPDQSAAYVDRAVRCLPPGTRWLTRLPLARRALATPTTRRALAATEDLIPVHRRIRRDIQALRPDVVVCSPANRHVSAEVEYLKAARALGIPTVLPVFSWDNLSTKSLIRVAPDLLLAWNAVHAREAVTIHGIPPERIAVTGAPFFDKWFPPDQWSGTPRVDYVASVGLDPSRPYLLYLGSSGQIAPDETAVVKALLRLLRQASDSRVRAMQVLVRPHPANTRAWTRLRDPDVHVCTHGRLLPDDQPTQQEFVNAIRHSVLAVGVNTSAMIDAVILGHPVAALVLDQYQSTQADVSHFQSLRAAGCLHDVADLSELLTLLAGLDDVEAPRRQRAEAFVAQLIRPRGLVRPAGEVAAWCIERAGTRMHPSEIIDELVEVFPAAEDKHA